MEQRRGVEDARRAVEAAAREHFARMSAGLIRACGGDFQLAEDALQDAMVAALDHWATEGVPPNPAGWLVTTARRKAIDQLRRERVLEQKRGLLGRLLEREGEEERDAALGEPEETVEDDRLRLIFTCCHPALSLETQVALTLRTVAGLDPAEIARAFLVSTDTMAKRLVRARQKIRDARIPYRVPEAHQLVDRLAGALNVVYLVFNEGYTASGSDVLVRGDLCDEAIRLGRLMAALMPDEPEVLGLLALMLLIDARRAARLDAAGELVTLEEQDRSLWNRQVIGEGVALVERALTMRRPGSFQLQAAIAALHAEAERPDQCDWPQIARVYGELYRLQPTPVVALNRAAVVGMAWGPRAGLALMDRLRADAAMGSYHLFHAARADLLRRAHVNEEAAAAYRRALDCCANAIEARYLRRRLAEVTA
jgi:RNA polymerase sigma-70 factor (ECF subfamily)